MHFTVVQACRKIGALYHFRFIQLPKFQFQHKCIKNLKCIKWINELMIHEQIYLMFGSLNQSSNLIELSARKVVL